MNVQTQKNKNKIGLIKQTMEADAIVQKVPLKKEARSNEKVTVNYKGIYINILCVFVLFCFDCANSQ